MVSSTERIVLVNHEQEIYTIRHADGGGYSTLGFDVCIDRAERIGLELTMRRIFGFEDAVKDMPRGSLQAYDTYMNLLDRLRRAVEETGERAIYDLTPQLNQWENWRVEVEDMHGDVRRFWVGKSTGWAPCHLEIKTKRSHGGLPAAREYKRVTPLYS